MATFRSYDRADFSAPDSIEYTTGNNFSNFTFQGQTVTSFILHFSDSYQRWFTSLYPVGTDDYDGSIHGMEEYSTGGVLNGSITGFSMTLGQYEQMPDVNTFRQFVLRSDDIMYGSSFGDVMMGYAGNDYIMGGTDDYDYDDGSDVLLGNAGNDTIIGLYGDDSMVGGSDLLDNTDGNDIMWGWYGNDHLYGSGGNDSLYGGDGNDLLVGVWGNDLIAGDNGNDIIVFFGASGYDTLLGFQQGDTLSIARTASIQSFADLTSRMFSDSNGTFIQLEAGSGITLAGVSASQLDASDFYFWG